MLRITTALACLMIAGCEVCEVPNGSSRVFIDLGVEADLHALDRDGGTYLAAGSAGTIVVWGTDHTRADPLTSVARFEVGEVELHAVLIAGRDFSPTGFWAVGDAGTVALSDNYGATWSVATLTPADLHAITEHDNRLILAGDEIVLVRQFDGTWIEPPTPPSGWGSIRGLASDGERVHAVGLGGVAWSASDPLGEWIAEPTGVDADLLDVGGSYPLVAVGAAGTVLVRDSNAWVSVESGVSVDLIDYHGRVLAADGAIYRLEEDGRLSHEEDFPGALAIHHHGSNTFVVGEGGLATAPAKLGCE